MLQPTAETQFDPFPKRSAHFGNAAKMRHLIYSFLLLGFLHFPGVGAMTTWANDALAKTKTKTQIQKKFVPSPVTISPELFERLLRDYWARTASDLHNFLPIDPQDEDKIERAYELAAKAAREKQRALSTTGRGKVPIRLGTRVTLRGLDEAAIDTCVAVFSRNLQIAISNNTRKILCLEARGRLRGNYSDTFAVELGKFQHPNSSMGERGSGNSLPHLQQYYLILHRAAEGAPAGTSARTSLNEILEGRRFDFLTIDTGEEGAKPAVEKPEEAPAK